MRWGREELVAVACDLCGGREVVLCAACGLAFVLPRPRDELVQPLYGRECFSVLEKSTPEADARTCLAFASLWEMLLRRAAALGLIRTHHPYIMGGTRHNLLAVLVRPSENAREDLRT
jgi:hypothetical protein